MPFFFHLHGEGVLMHWIGFEKNCIAGSALAVLAMDFDNLLHI